jgi:hypothetical protein
MAARKQLWHPDDVRQKIQTSQLINRLTEHALSAEPIMDASQVNAAVRLIGKVIPDLKAVEHSGDPENPVKHVHTVERRIVRPDAPDPNG